MMHVGLFECPKGGMVDEMKRYVALSVLTIASYASAMTPGGIDRKFVGVFSDVVANSPAAVLAHADELDKIPWLDGLAINLKGVEVSTVDGSSAKSESMRVMTHGHEWSRKSVSTQLGIFRELVRHRCMKEGFLLVRMTPAANARRIAWNDDEEWARFSRNMAALAWFAKEAGLKGVMLDPGDRTRAVQYRYSPGDAPTFAECVALARRRGRELFSAIFKEHPSITLFFLRGLEDHVRSFTGKGQTDPKQLSDDAGELFPCFLNGMLDVMPVGVTFVDGAANSGLSAVKGEWWDSAINRIVGAKPFIEPENLARYRAQLSVGQGLSFDRVPGADEDGRESDAASVDRSPRERLRRNLDQMIEGADRYVCIFGGKGRIIDWKTPADGELWENQIPGLAETLMFAKDPDELMRRRMADLRRKGLLVNLVEGQCKLPQTYYLEDKPTRMAYPKPPSLKGVKPGELYCVRQAFRAWMREGLPEVKVTWRKAGQPVAENASVRLVTEPPRGNNPPTAQAYVAVPDGADELVVDVEGVMYPGDKYYVGTTEIHLLDYAPRKNAPPAEKFPEIKPSGRKWKYDAATKTLSDGNWTLAAKPVEGDKTKKRLYVHGKNSPGAGVLDFRNVEADTGMKVTAIDGFIRNTAITDVVGPDIDSVCWECFRHCSRLRSVKLSPDLAHLALGAFSDATNLVHFSPTVFKSDIRIGLGIFIRSSNLTGDFRYEGGKELPEGLFWGTAIRSFTAPRCFSLGQSTFSCCSNLEYLSFAEGKTFANLGERAEFLFRQRKRAGLWKNLTPQFRFGRDVAAKPKGSARLHPSPVVKDARPGELYGVFVSMKATWTLGCPQLEIRWRKNSHFVGGWYDQRAFSFSGRREDGVTRTASVLVRIPEIANGFSVEVKSDLYPGESYVFDKVEIYKLGEPPPPWPAERLKEKTSPIDK